MGSIARPNDSAAGRVPTGRSTDGRITVGRFTVGRFTVGPGGGDCRGRGSCRSRVGPLTITALVATLAISGLAAVAGCSEPVATEPTYPASGQIVRGDRPIHYAAVVLHRRDDADGQSPKPRGTTDSQGRFQLTTHQAGDGAPQGTYTITVEQWATVRPDEGPRNQLKPKYASPQTSGIEVTINAGDNQLPTIRVD